MGLKFAIIGAGVSGLSAARALVERGHRVTVFERAPVPGGRVATKTIDAIELPRGLSGVVAFDHGAQYFTVRDDRFSLLAAEMERDRAIAKWKGRIVSFDGEGWDDPESETSRYVGTPGMSAIAEWMARGIEVRYGQKVESIEPLRAEFDHVIRAVPAPTSPMATCWTVMAAFEERVAARFDGAFVSGSPLGWIARNSSKPKRNWKIDTWVLQATTAWSDAHAGDRVEDVGAFLMGAFDDLISAGLPRAFYATVHRWKYPAADVGSRIEDAYLRGLNAADGLTA